MTLSLFEMAQPLDKDAQNKLVDLMATRGHNFSWEGIRYVLTMLFSSPIFCGNWPLAESRVQLGVPLPIVAVNDQTTGPSIS